MATEIVGTTCTARLRDGRSVTFSAAGPQAGFPVVYCHGAIGSPRWRTPELDALIERLGIRYFLVNRPGFGGSDPHPGRTVADFARDLGDLMDTLGYRRFSVVGVSAGAPYALACGWALPERISALAAVSPLGPSHGLGASSSLRYRLPLAPFVSEGLGPVLAGLCLRALGLGGQTAPKVMIDDYLVCRRHWGFDPTEVRSPVTLWHGRGDRLVPLAHSLSLAAAIPACMTRVDPTGGHFFYSRRLAEIVGPLVPRAGAGLSARASP
jgi:pimeloyl-ACP methyl ester carboxylesterase